MHVGCCAAKSTSPSGKVIRAVSVFTFTFHTTSIFSVVQPKILAATFYTTHCKIGIMHECVLRGRKFVGLIKFVTYCHNIHMSSLTKLN